jgi:hypothetical protein
MDIYKQNEFKKTLKIHSKISFKIDPTKILFRSGFNIPNSKYNMRFKIISYQTSSTTFNY